MKDHFLTLRAKYMRKHMTPAETLLWTKLRARQTGVYFRRQQPMGPYIADFYCAEKKLIIEVDGGQHSEEKDFERTRYLESNGYLILRFWNNDVLENIDGVVYKIQSVLEPPPLNPLPQGEGRFLSHRIGSRT